MSTPAIRLENVRVWRGDSTRSRRVALEDASLQVGCGERVSLVGPNGAGKTSLLLALVGAVPFEGRILIGELDLNRQSVQSIRNSLGFVFADPADQLFLPTVGEEVAFGPRQRGWPEEETHSRAQRALAAVGLSGFEARAPTALSLGEQRRLSVATVLSSEPSVVLIDEPTASLDPVARRAMLKTIAALDATVIMASHDLDAMLDLDARVVLLKAGTIVHDGPAAQVLSDEKLLERAGLTLPISVAARRGAATQT